MMSQDSREQVLGDIRRALNKSDRRDSQPAVESREVDKLAAEVERRCEQNRAALIDQFESELKKIGGHVHRAANLEAAAAGIAEVISSSNAKSVFAWDGLVSALGLSKRFEANDITLITEIPAAQFTEVAASCEVGLSGVDYVLADTGTLVLLAGKGRPRSASLLPAVHVALVKSDQIISGLDELFPLLRRDQKSAGADLASAITFITGPSRTADIELTLVIGVHGPQQLHVVLLDS